MYKNVNVLCGTALGNLPPPPLFKDDAENTPGKGYVPVV